jgi:hypothetical protein
MNMTYNSAPILVFFLILLWRIVQAIFGSGEEEEEEGEQLVEGLPEYYQALKQKDKAKICGQEEYYKYNYSIKSYSDESYAQLKGRAKDRDVGNCFQGTATYRLLDSLTYEQAFQFEGPLLKEDGSTERKHAIKISTDETEDMPEADKAIDPQQHDATYMAVYYPFLPTAS